MESNLAPSYADDLRDIDSTQGWETATPTLVEGKQNDQEYIFQRIAQLTCYMPERDRQEIVDLLKAASGFSTGKETTGTATDQAPSAAYDAQALSGVVLERTSNTGAAKHGQTELTRGEVRQILARGPVPQNKSQTEDDLQIQMHLSRPGTKAGMVVPILRSRKHPMFPNNAITRDYAGIGESHGQLPNIPDVLRSHSKSFLKEINPTQNIRAEQRSEYSSSSLQRSPRRPRTLGLDEMPQFRTEIIPHELPVFLADRLPPRPELAAVPKPEPTEAPKAATTVALDTSAANGVQPKPFRPSSIRKSMWAPGPDDRIPSKILAEVQNLRLAERLEAQTPNLRSASKIEHTRVEFVQSIPESTTKVHQVESQPRHLHAETVGTQASDAGAAARVQYADTPILGTIGTNIATAPQHRFLPLTSTSRPSDPGAAARAQYAMPSTIAPSEDLSAAARAQYAGHRRVYSGDQDSLEQPSTSDPSDNRNARAQRDAQGTGRSR